MKFDGKAEWKVTPQYLVIIDAQQFVQFSARDCGLARLVAEQVVCDKGLKNLSLANLPGMQELLLMRNEQQVLELVRPSRA